MEEETDFFLIAGRGAQRTGPKLIQLLVTLADDIGGKKSCGSYQL